MAQQPVQPGVRESGEHAERRVIHGAFTLVRHLPAEPARVFAYFAELELRKRWFRIPGVSGGHVLDFRVGGGEVASAIFAPAGVEEHVEYRARFLEIQREERIVLSAEVLLDGLRRIVSQVTIELAPEAGGTRLTYTDQHAVLVPTGDGSADLGERKGGTQLLLNRLQFALEDAEAVPSGASIAEHRRQT